MVLREAQAVLERVNMVVAELGVMEIEVVT